MNISYNWLKQYIDTDLSPEDLSKALTSIGLETGSIEKVQTVKGGLEGLVIGEVLTCTGHPNSDHLHLTTVNVGDAEPLKIVCGAPNVSAGQKVVVATIGTVLYSGEESFTIKRSKIRGEESFGMICAEDEIGIGTSHEGIIVLPAEAVVGTPAKEYYNVKDDYVLEVDITPNRIDAASHFGVARDLAAYLAVNGLKGQLTKPSVEAFATDNHNLPVTVTVENHEACPRYSGVSIAGVTIKESPEWLQNYLKAIGLRPINNVVDVTNFILHETGQPLHSFDADKIAGKQVIVKTLPEGTKFTTLDGTERNLSDNDLMICDSDGGMCIAGVFGGLDSGVADSTVNVFLESAYFNPVWVRKTARRHGLNTDSSFRFERGCDPNNTVYVLKRAALLIKELAGGAISSDIVDVYPEPIKPFEVDITFEKINSLIGKNIPVETVKNILANLEIGIVSETAEGLKLHVPTYRVDVQRDVDVIEDLLRIYGYNNILPGESVKTSISYSPKPDSHKLQNLIAGQLTGCGFNEILNNSLTKAGYYESLAAYPATRLVMIMNPLSADLNAMRQTLLFGGLESVAYNVNRKNQDLKFYEFGNCYYHDAGLKEEGKPLAGYSEDFHLGLWLTGNKSAQSWVRADEKTSAFELKAHVHNVLRRLGVNLQKLVTETETGNDLFAEALKISTRQGKQLAILGEVAKKQLKVLDIDVAVFFADLNWNNLLDEAARNKVTFKEISKFPEVKRDLALLLDNNTAFAEIERIAFATEKNILKKVQLFDVYEGKNLESGKKSYAVSFTLQDNDKTLNDKQIDSIMQRLIKQFEEKLGAKLR
jgi:phenylalanyl-tRNA synthetase beta chain